MKQEYIICTLTNTVISVNNSLTIPNSGTLGPATTNVYRTKKDAELAAKALARNTSMLIIPVTVIRP